MDIYIQSTIGICDAYMPQNNKMQSINVIISPLQITGEETNLKISSGCNLWQSCHNSGCYFSMASRKKNEARN